MHSSVKDAIIVTIVNCDKSFPINDYLNIADTPFNTRLFSSSVNVLGFLVGDLPYDLEVSKLNLFL